MQGRLYRYSLSFTKLSHGRCLLLLLICILSLLSSACMGKTELSVPCILNVWHILCAFQKKKGWQSLLLTAGAWTLCSVGDFCGMHVCWVVCSSSTCSNPSVGWGGEVCCMYVPSYSLVVRHGIRRNIFMLEQQNAKGSNFLFMQNNSGLLA